MKNKIFIIPAIVILAGGLFYWFMVENGYSPYYEGMTLEMYSEYELQEIQKNSQNKEVLITRITDSDLREFPELKKLIEKAFSKNPPLNEVGRVPITFDQLNRFQQQYAQILADKYSRNSTSFFSANSKGMPEKFLEIDPSVHLRSFEGRYFEYKGTQYGIQPDSFYVPNMEDDENLRLEVYKTNGPLREWDHVWADLTDSKIELTPQIESAIDDIGSHQENIRVQTSGLSPSTIKKYKDWKEENTEGFLFEYREKIFSIGFWIA